MHNSQYFTEILHLATYFKITAPSLDIAIPESIRLATFPELIANIEEDKFQTELIHQMLCFLVDKVKNPNFEKSLTRAGLAHLLTTQLQIYRRDIIRENYLHLALEESFCLSERIAGRARLREVSYFYQLDRELKYQVLRNLTKNLSDSSANIKKITNDEEEQPNHQEEEKGSKQKEEKEDFSETVLILGEDDYQLYYYFPFLPNSIFSYRDNRWKNHSREQILDKVENWLQAPQSPHMLNLIEQVINVVENHMKKGQIKDLPFKLHKLRALEGNEASNVDSLKQIILQFQQRYLIYQKGIKNRVYSPLSVRKKLISLLENATTMNQLLDAYLFFYQNAREYVYQCCVQNDEHLQPEEEEDAYLLVKKPTTNVFMTRILLGDKYYNNYQLSEALFDERVDAFPFLKIVLVCLTNGLEYLQKKSYEFKKRMEKQAEEKKQKKSLSSSSFDMLEQNQPMKLRKRSGRVGRDSSSSRSFDLNLAQQKPQQRNLRKKPRKNMQLDSDEESDEEYESSLKSTQSRNQFSKYELRSRV